MRKEWLLLAATVLVTVALALGLVRWYAPGLLGARADLQVVKTSEEVPPFYDNAIRMDDIRSAEFHLKDPFTGTRHRPMVPELNLSEGGVLWGPDDLLGFRNRSVPVVADIVTIGDSLTFGSNATMDFNWPSLLGRSLTAKGPVVYNMSSGGWGILQYLYMFDKAAAFRPRVVVIAISTGGEAPKAVRMAYTNDLWAGFRRSDARPEGPPTAWPPRESELWPVAFEGGPRLVFTPLARLAANDRRYPATREGYDIVREGARRIDARAGVLGIPVVFTVIPNKELVYAERVRRAGIDPPEAYRRLVADEAQNIGELARALGALPHAEYVDAVGPLQRAALEDMPLYTREPDGHPVATGYDVIAQALAPVVARHLPDRPADGVAAVRRPDADEVAYTLIRGDEVWAFDAPQTAAANGWDLRPQAVRLLQARDVAGLTFRGVIHATDPARFGPQAIAR